jgi:hypothetical protein
MSNTLGHANSYAKPLEDVGKATRRCVAINAASRPPSARSHHFMN